MNVRIAVVILGLLVLGLGGYLAVNSNKPGQIPFDFGDASDGSFPSLLKSDGARAKRTDEIWLGKEVTKESDSKQVNLDEGDDGLKLDLKSCQTSKAYFYVHLKTLGQTGTAYLNLWADWNKDGKWQGSDECAQEWAVRNFQIDLSNQYQEIAVYVPEFTAGKNIQDIWYRGIVSLNQQMNEGSTGEFASGEVEDYNSEQPGEEKYYGAYCDPYPLIINHGSKGNIKVLPVFFSEPINKLEFAQNYNPADDKRKVSIQNNIVTYESAAKDIDPPKRSVNHFVELKAGFGAGGTETVLEGWCKVVVEHDEITIETPSRRNLPRKLPTGTIETGQPTPHIQEKTPGLMGY